MARQIFAEEQNTLAENASEEVIIREESTALDNAKDGVIVYADEMEKLFHEWDANGKNDLYVNSTLADRIRQYLDYQMEMDPLRKEMAARIYAPFKVNNDAIGNKGNNTSVYVDGKYLTMMKVYEYAGTKRVVRICDFKTILMAIDNPYACWIDDDGYVDLKGYITSIGYSYEYEESSYSNDIHIKK